MAKDVRVRVFSDRPVDLNIIWFIVVVLLVALSTFLGYKLLTINCPDVTCQACPTCPSVPSCNLDCASCPTKEVTVEKEVIKYKCPNSDDYVDDPDLCAVPLDEIKLVTTNEDDSFIKKIAIYPSCVDYNIGGTISVENGVIANSIIIQVKEPGKNYVDKYSFGGVFSGHKSFGICESTDKSCQVSIGDFYLEPHKRYVMRIKFDLTKTYGEVQYSNEYIVDTTAASKFVTNNCQVR